MKGQPIHIVVALLCGQLAEVTAFEEKAEADKEADRWRHFFANSQQRDHDVHVESLPIGESGFPAERPENQYVMNIETVVV